MPHFSYTLDESAIPPNLTCGVCHDVAVTHRGCPQCKATFCKVRGHDGGRRHPGGGRRCTRALSPRALPLPCMPHAARSRRSSISLCWGAVATIRYSAAEQGPSRGRARPKCSRCRPAAGRPPPWQPLAPLTPHPTPLRCPLAPPKPSHPQECLDQWFDTQKRNMQPCSCPYCRRPLRYSQLRHDPAVQAQLDALQVGPLLALDHTRVFQ